MKSSVCVQQLIRFFQQSNNEIALDSNILTQHSFDSRLRAVHSFPLEFVEPKTSRKTARGNWGAVNIFCPPKLLVFPRPSFCVPAFAMSFPQLDELKRKMRDCPQSTSIQIFTICCKTELILLRLDKEKNVLHAINYAIPKKAIVIHGLFASDIVLLTIDKKHLFLNKSFERFERMLHNSLLSSLMPTNLD